MLKNSIFYYLLIYLTLYSWSILFVQWGALLFSLVIGTIDLRFSSLREKQRGKKFFFTKQSKKKEQCLPQCTFKSHTELDSQPLLHLASQMRRFPKIHCNSQLMKIQFYIIYPVSNIMDMAWRGNASRTHNAHLAKEQFGEFQVGSRNYIQNAIYISISHIQKIWQTIDTLPSTPAVRTSKDSAQLIATLKLYITWHEREATYINCLF